MERKEKNDFNFNSIPIEIAKKYNSQVLAFMGDAVYSMYIRNKIILSNSASAGKLHALSTNFVKASGQSNFLNTLLPLLTEEELAVFKRARNYKTHTTAKNATVIEYRRATGFEAVLGFLYLSGQKDRLNEILSFCKGEEKC